MKSKGIRERNAGGFALARVGKRQVHIASEMSVSAVTIHQWMSGEKRPSWPNRELAKSLYGIEEQAWDEPHAKGTIAPSRKAAPLARALPKPTVPTEEDDATAAGGAFAMARSLQRQAQAQLDELNTAGLDWTPAERVRIMQGLAGTINVLAKITGQYELGRRILKLPFWLDIEAAIYEALKPYPEVAKVVDARLSLLRAKQNEG